MERPAVISTLGLLNIIFAAVGVVGMLGGLMTISAPSAGNPILDALTKNPDYIWWLKVTLLPGLLAEGALLASGIGLLKMKPWARTLAVGWAVYSVFAVIVTTFVSFVLVYRPMYEAAAKMAGPDKAGMIGGAVGGAVGGFLGLAYPVVILVLLTRRKTAAAFLPSAGPLPLPPVV